MNFAVKLADLKRQPFLWVPGDPKEIVVGGKRYQTLICIDPAYDLVRVELRPVMKENDHAKP
jgi:hypothetical protein